MVKGTAKQVEDLVGAVADAQTLLSVGATETAHLREVAGAKVSSPPSLLLRSAMANNDPELMATYKYIHKMVQDEVMRQEFLLELFPPQHDDGVEPPAFFQVALDLPQLGRSEEELARYKTAPELHRAVLKDVIKCLGKDNAFAVVAYERGVDALLNAVTQEPTITSFCVARDPDWSSLVDTPNRLHTMLQPVLLICDSDDAVKSERAAGLRKHLLNCEAPNFSHSLKPEYYDKEAGRDMLLHFHAHHWKGACGLGLSNKGQLQTRHAGGIKAWESGVDFMTDDSPGGSPEVSPVPSPSKARRSISPNRDLARDVQSQQPAPAAAPGAGAAS